MASSEDNQQWLVESLIGFLKSPLWIHPIQSFIDENCLIFDSEDENKFTYSEVYNKFREMIEGLLDMHLQDMGVTVEQFIECCTSGRNEELTGMVIEHIMALDDFPSFKKMMEKRNMELEVEALRGIKEKKKLIEEDKEKLELEMAIAASIQEKEIKDRQSQLEDVDLQTAIAMSVSLQDEEIRSILDQFEKLEAQQRAEKEFALALAAKMAQEQQMPNHILQEQKELDQQVIEQQPGPPIQRESGKIQEPTDVTVTQLISEAERDEEILKQRMLAERQKQEEAIQKLLEEKNTIKKELSEMERLEAEKFEKLKQAAQKLKAAQKQNSVSPSSSSSAISQNELPPVVSTVGDLSARKAYMLAQKQRLVALKKSQREKTMKELQHESSEDLSPEDIRISMNDALARKVKGDLVRSASQAKLVEEKNNAKLEQQPVENITGDEQEINEELQKMQSKKKAMQSIFNNSDAQVHDDFTYSEL